MPRRATAGARACDAAAFARATAEQVATGRVLSWDMAHFIHFHDGKVASARAVYDGFDIVEQAIGHLLAVGS